MATFVQCTDTDGHTIYLNLDAVVRLSGVVNFTHVDLIAPINQKTHLVVKGTPQALISGTISK